MYHVVCCNKYHHVGESVYKDEALRIADSHQCPSGPDSIYAVLIQDANGRIVGDNVDGFHDRKPEHPVCHAEQTASFIYNEASLDACPY